MDLIALSVTDFIAETASDAPAPGGGSVSALCGSLSAALAQMVIRLTTGKKTFKTLDEQIQHDFSSKLSILETLQKKLLSLIDEDTAAFNSFMEALKLPKETESEQHKRTAALATASLISTQIPLATARTCLEILRILPIIAEYGNKNAASDAGVAALTARAGLEGAILNVTINIPGLANETDKKNFASECTALLAEGEKLKTTILQKIYSKL